MWEFERYDKENSNSSYTQSLIFGNSHITNVTFRASLEILNKNHLVPTDPTLRGHSLINDLGRSVLHIVAPPWPLFFWMGCCTAVVRV